jgi:hypothetical protein
LEQLLLRGGLTYTPESINVKFTLGYAYILNGEFGDSSDTSDENRIYQEALLPQKLGERTYINHRFRFEQRWVEDQDFRTRLIYNLLINIALNRKELVKGTFYYAFYNEIFINGQRDTGDGREVELFDRNRFYNAIGYCITDKLRFRVVICIRLPTTGAKANCSLAFIIRFKSIGFACHTIGHPH